MIGRLRDWWRTLREARRLGIRVIIGPTGGYHAERGQYVATGNSPHQARAIAVRRLTRRASERTP